VGDGRCRLRAGRSIWLATVRPDGRPIVAPLWYWWDGDADPPCPYFITVRTTHNARNIAHNDWAEAHLGDGDEVLILRGHARMVDDADELGRVDDA